MWRKRLLARPSIIPERRIVTLPPNEHQENFKTHLTPAEKLIAKLWQHLLYSILPGANTAEGSTLHLLYNVDENKLKSKNTR